MRSLTLLPSASALLFCVIGLGCSSSDAFVTDDPDVSSDATSESSSDSQAADTGGTGDSTSTDTGATDGPADAPADSSADTGGKGDTGVGDVGADVTIDATGDAIGDSIGDAMADTTPETGVDGGTCPAPASTAVFDASGLSCSELQAKYPNAVNEAKSCGCTADCSQTLCDTLCCNCSSFVNPGTDAYVRAKAMAAEWKKRVAAGTCTPPICPLFVCPTPVLAGCKAGSTTAKVCTKGP